MAKNSYLAKVYIFEMSINYGPHSVFKENRLLSTTAIPNGYIEYCYYSDCDLNGGKYCE